LTLLRLAPRHGRETLDAKAARYLAEGRLTVTRVGGGAIDAICRGTTLAWEVGYRRGGWFCTCPAAGFGSRCSHLAALQLVTVRPTRREVAHAG
jgi:uncharacterized Zn finger protein